MALLQKMTYNSRHPVGLHYPVFVLSVFCIFQCIQLFGGFSVFSVYTVYTYSVFSHQHAQYIHTACFLSVKYCCRVSREALCIHFQHVNINRQCVYEGGVYVQYIHSIYTVVFTNSSQELKLNGHTFFIWPHSFYFSYAYQ